MREIAEAKQRLRLPADCTVVGVLAINRQEPGMRRGRPDVLPAEDTLEFLPPRPRQQVHRGGSLFLPG